MRAIALRFIIAAAIAAIPVLTSCSTRPLSTSPAVVQEGLGRQLDAHLSSRQPSGVFLLARGDTILLAKGYGRTSEAGVPIDVNTVFPIGSLTKQFTAAAVLRLAERRKLGLNDPISRFFPDAPADKRSITVHQLLSHTSGLTRNVHDFKEAVTRDEFRCRLFASKLEFEPGSRHVYANTGYLLLALIIEEASGRTYDQFLDDALIRPLGLVNTGMVGPRFAGRTIPEGRDRPRFNETYSGTPMDEAYALPPYMYQRGAGGLMSTVGDLHRWQAALRAGRVLTPAYRDLMFTPHGIITPNGRYKYGYGWVLQETGAGPKVWHNGVWFSYYSELWTYPERDVVAIGLTNHQGDEFDETFRKVVGLVLEATPAPAGTGFPAAAPVSTAPTASAGGT